MRLRSCLALLLIATQGTGCATFVGGGVGAVADMATAPAKAPLAGLDHLEMDRRIRVRLRTGQTIDGTYQGLRVAPEEYAARYAARATREHDARLPDQGDRVTLALAKGRMLKGRLTGFEPARVIVETDGDGERMVRTTEIETLFPATGDPISPMTLARLESGGAVPYRSRLAIGESVLSLEDVRRVELPGSIPSSGKIFGMTLGAVLDVMLIIALRNGFEE